MLISQKSQYAIRSVFELAKSPGKEPVKIAKIAKAQAIPINFLETILNELKHGGFVISQRGKEGGYNLRIPPKDLAVGDIIKFMQGSPKAVDCVMGKGKNGCPMAGKCVFHPMWQDVQQALTQVYDKTKFQDLVEKDRLLNSTDSLNYSI